MQIKGADYSIWIVISDYKYQHFCDELFIPFISYDIFG